MKIFILVLSFLLVFSSILHVDPSGQDIISCGPDTTPCKTAEYTIEKAIALDTILFKSTVIFPIIKTITIHKSLTLASNGESSTIQCAKKDFEGFVVVGATLIVRNIQFQQCHSDTGGGVFRIRESNTNFTGCTFFDNQAKFGGAINFLNSRGSFENCVFRQNRANHANNGVGGAVVVDNSDVNFFKSNFENNFALEKAGALSVREANVVIDNCRFTSNSVANIPGSSRHSGAINVDGATLFIVRNSHFVKNRAQAFGAIGGTGIITIQRCHFEENVSSKPAECAVDIDFGRIVDSVIVKNVGCGLSTSSSVVSGCRIVQNTGIGMMETETLHRPTEITDTLISENEQGGLLVSDTKVHVLRVRIQDNKGEQFGGLSIENLSESWFKDVVITSNRGVNGGGISISKQTKPLSITNAMISENHATNGAGLFISKSQLDLVFSNVDSNQASVGAGIFITDSTLTFTNSTLSRNEAQIGGGIHCTTSSLVTPRAIQNIPTNYQCTNCQGCQNN